MFCIHTVIVLVPFVFLSITLQIFRCKNLRLPSINIWTFTLSLVCYKSCNIRLSPSSLFRLRRWFSRWCISGMKTVVLKFDALASKEMAKEAYTHARFSSVLGYIPYPIVLENVNCIIAGFLIWSGSSAFVISCWSTDGVTIIYIKHQFFNFIIKQFCDSDFLIRVGR